MFSYKYKYIFVHIPKTGGSSLEHRLHTAESINPYYNWLPPHLTIAEHAQVFSDVLFGDCYKWTVVRNPHERFLSAYYWRKHWYLKEGNHEQAAVSVEDFALNTDTIGTRKDDPTHLLPQHQFTHIDGICQCDLYRYEDGLDNIIRSVCKKIQQRGFQKFPTYDTVAHSLHRIPRERKPYSETMSKEAIATITERYQKDFELFHY